MHENRLASIPIRLHSCGTIHFFPKSDILNPFRRRIATSASEPLERLDHRLLSILQDFSDPSDLRSGRQVHTQAVVNGIGDVGSLGNRLLGMYVLCGSLPDAKDLFFRLDRGAPLPWNWMIRGFTMMGRFEHAVLLYLKMWDRGALPDKYTFPFVIKACCGLSAVGLGRLVHDTIRSLGLEDDAFIASSLIKMYVEGDSVHDARDLFDKMSTRDCVLWNVMIDGYIRSKCTKEAIGLFSCMRRSESKPNYVTFASVLSACASEAMLDFGIQLHGLAIRCGVEFEAPVANTLVALYSKCRYWSDMHKVYDLMPQVSQVTWNGIISGYVQNGLMEEALASFYKMQSFGVSPDSVTFTSLLPAFSDCSGLKQGKEIQAYILRNNVYLDKYLKSALIDVYLNCRDVKMAENVFYSSETVDVVICSTMISGYVLNGMSFDALEMFRLLIKREINPNTVTVASILPACSYLTTLRLGKELHCYALRKAFTGRCYVGSALTDMYAKCGRVNLAYEVFARMPEKDPVAWNSMISSFAQNAEPEEAINLFRKMGLQGFVHDCVSISSALSACSNLPALHYGKEIHCFMIRGALGPDLYAESALIDMYAKCGQLAWSHRVFDNMPRKSEVSWNSIIAAYGIHGHVKDAGALFLGMKEAGFFPDDITFLSMISACGHAGRVEEGFQYFKTMSQDYGLLPRMEHYACMVDLFGRAGWLHEALSFIKEMPFEPDAGIWGALLGACRVHRNVELAELASRHLFQLDPQNSGYYILLSNVHAVTGGWEGVSKVRSLMKERGVQKSPGCSWVDINYTSHMFIAADKNHPDSAEIYLYLDLLLFELKKEGYIPQPECTHPLPREYHLEILIPS